MQANNKKLSYRRVTARCVLSVVILPIATQQCRNYLYDQRRQSKYILGAIEAPRGVGSTAPRLPPLKFFLILDLKMAICGAFVVQVFAVQLKL